MYEKVIISKVLKMLENIEFGKFILQLENGKVYSFEGKQKGPNADLLLHSNNVLKNMLFGGDVAFARDYKNNLWDSKNVANLIEWSILNESVLKKFIFGNLFSQILNRLSYLFKRNTEKNSKNNIYQHYDLGNDFYKLWLDESMTYSSAIFKSQNESLGDGQSNKYNRILERVNKSDKILEIGCGWGGFMEKAIEQDCNIDGLTISQAQFDYAKNRLKPSLNQHKNIFLRDYRKHTGVYKTIVSIEMFEAVGENYWGTYFDKIKNYLHQTGKAIIQTITIANEYFDSYRKSGDAIRSYIFPGGMLASTQRFEQELTNKSLQIIDKFEFGLDYTKTLQLWLNRFNDKKLEILNLNFDESFCRLWTFYLSYCIGAFRSGRINVMQATLCHK